MPIHTLRRIHRLAWLARIILASMLTGMAAMPLIDKATGQPASERIAVLSEQVQNLKAADISLGDQVRSQQAEINEIKHQQWMFQGGVVVVGGLFGVFQLIASVTGKRLGLRDGGGG